MEQTNSGSSSPFPPVIPEHPFTDIPGLQDKHPRKPARHLLAYLPALLLLGFLPVATGAVLFHQYLSGSASNLPWLCRQKITTVRINPGKIDTFADSRLIQMSALAYDSEGRPIWTGVAFEWGMSSSNTIGNIIPKGQLATFKPLNTGTGNIYVTGQYCGQKAVGSSHVTVYPAIPTPTSNPKCLPRPKCLDSKPVTCKIVMPAQGWCHVVNPYSSNSQ